MTITHSRAQKILKTECDDWGVDGMPCKVCGKKIYPPDYPNDTRADDPATYHYIGKGQYHYFIHRACLQKR